MELGVERHAKTIEMSAWDAIRSKSETSKKLAALRERVSQQMTAMVDEIRGQVTAVIAEREQSQIKIEDELAKLTQIRDALSTQLKTVQGVLMELS